MCRVFEGTPNGLPQPKQDVRWGDRRGGEAEFLRLQDVQRTAESILQVLESRWRVSA